MKFITDNKLIIIIVLSLIIVTIIGYLFDKHFVNKDNKGETKKK